MTKFTMKLQELQTPSKSKIWFTLHRVTKTKQLVTPNL